MNPSLSTIFPSVFFMCRSQWRFTRSLVPIWAPRRLCAVAVAKLKNRYHPPLICVWGLDHKWSGPILNGATCWYCSKRWNVHVIEVKSILIAVDLIATPSAWFADLKGFPWSFRLVYGIKSPSRIFALFTYVDVFRSAMWSVMADFVFRKLKLYNSVGSCEFTSGYRFSIFIGAPSIAPQTGNRFHLYSDMSYACFVLSFSSFGWKRRLA